MATSTPRCGNGNTPIRVVVASRDRPYSASLAAQLKRAGMGVSRCTPGEECSAMADDIAQADVLVVESDGSRDDERELVARVRAMSPLVEVIAISAKGFVAEAVRGFRSGLYAVMEHPVATDELVATVCAACERKRRAEARIRELDRARSWKQRGARAPRSDSGDDGSREGGER